MTSQNSITIEIPEGVDEAAIRVASLDAIRAQQVTAKNNALVSRILEDDEYFKKRYAGKAVVRKNTYGDDHSVYYAMWFFGLGEPTNWNWARDNRKPVPMRGSLGEMIAKYGWSHAHSANGLATKIVKRYISGS